MNARDLAGRTPLHVAAFVGDSAMVEMPAAAEADLDALDLDGQAAPTWAYEHAHRDVVASLVERGVDRTGASFDPIVA